MNSVINISLSNYNKQSLQQANEIRKVYDLSDTLALHKLAMGIFLDSYSLSPEATQELAQYEFFAGSLSQEKLVSGLRTFLDSEQAQEMKFFEPVKTVIKNFINCLEEGQDHAYQIDIARSRMIELVILVATGKLTDISESNHTAYQTQINQITKEALAKIQHLQTGEKVLFLTGSLLHDTRISVEKLDGEYCEVFHFDSARKSTCVSYKINIRTLYNEYFWNKIFELKFCNADDAIAQLDRHLSYFSHPDSTRALEVMTQANIATQKKNTCHVQSLLAFLKKELVLNSGLSPEQLDIAWADFKACFGKFLILENKIQDSTLLELSKRKQKMWNDKTELRLLFQHCINKGQCEQTLAAYQTILRALGYSKNVNSLKEAHKMLTEQLNQYYLLPEDLEQLVGKISNPCIQKTVAMFQNQLTIQSYQFTEQLQKAMFLAKESEAAKVKQHPRFMSEYMINAILGWYMENPQNLSPNLALLFEALANGDKKTLESILFRMNQQEFDRTIKELDQFKEVISDPIILEAIDIFKNQLMVRHNQIEKEHQVHKLERELHLAIRRSNSPNSPIVAPVNNQELEKILTQLIENPHLLEFLNKYSCYQSIYMRAFQNGKWEELEKILTKINQAEIDHLSKVSQTVNFCIPLIHRSSLEIYLAKHPDSLLPKVFWHVMNRSLA